jgi:CBS domain-containing protein
MTNTKDHEVNRPLTFNAETAADLMTPNPISIGQNATIEEAAAFLTDQRISAAPVIDDAGRAVGVLSRPDIVGHHRQEAQIVPTFSD